MNIFSWKIKIMGASLVMIFIILILSVPGCGRANKEETVVREITNTYMTNLKNKDFEALLNSTGIDLDESIKKQVISTFKEATTEAIDIDIKRFTIRDVKMEGSIAFVTVEENRKIAVRGGMTTAIDSDYKTVRETLVLIKREGRWKIDAVNTLHLSKIKLKEAPESIIKDINSTGVGRIFVIFMDPDISQLILAAIPMARMMGSNFLGARSQGQFTQCQSNMKNIATALEMYATDNDDHYPQNLDKLTPDYLRSIPTCAAAGKDTYTESYTVSSNHRVFTFYCSGNYHKNSQIPPNFPQYSSIRKLIPTP